MARQARQLVPKLPLEALHDEAIVTHAINLPLAFAHDLRRQRLEIMFAVRRHLDRWWFLDDVVEVLVQTIEEKSEKLLRIMLVRTAKLGRDATDVFTERDGREEDVVLSPDGPDELRHSISKGASGSEGVRRVDVSSVSAVWEGRRSMSTSTSA
jgi:hypothetical protein